MLETTQIQPTFKDLNEIVQDLYELHVHYQNILKIKNFMSFEEKYGLNIIQNQKELDTYLTYKESKTQYEREVQSCEKDQYVTLLKMNKLYDQAIISGWTPEMIIKVPMPDGKCCLEVFYNVKPHHLAGDWWVLLAKDESNDAKWTARYPIGSEDIDIHNEWTGHMGVWE